MKKGLYWCGSITCVIFIQFHFFIRINYGNKNLFKLSMPFTRSTQRVRQTSFNFFYLHLVRGILCILAIKVVLALKNWKNLIILLFAPLYLQHFVFCRFYRCLNLVYDRSNECKSFWVFLYYMSCHATFTPRNSSSPIITLPSTIICV